jgi:mannonate dehydratase
MIKIAESLPAQPTPLWKLVKQAGVDYAVGPLPFTETGTDYPWDLGPLSRMKQRFNDAGFELAVIESSPPMQKIRLGLPGRDDEIEHFCTMLVNMGKLGIPVVCHNFMAEIGWLRTRVDVPGRGGALVTGFYLEDLRDAPPAEAGAVPEERLWENMRYFLERVVPVAEKAGVRLAVHPDDPPLSPIRGVGRIMRTVDAFQRVIDMVPSPCNGITLCQGNFALMTPDLPATIRHFGRQGRIFFVHMRDVAGTAEGFVETFHDEGPTDLLACMHAYREVGFEGVLRPDHVPTMEGESNANPGYAVVGRLFAIGYLKGLRQAAYGRGPENAPAAA